MTGATWQELQREIIDNSDDIAGVIRRGGYYYHGDDYQLYRCIGLNAKGGIGIFKGRDGLVHLFRLSNVFKTKGK
jgi:hypothetical protein